MSDPHHTVAALRARHVGGLMITRCQHCGAQTKRTWAELGARDDEDMIAVADRALTCDGCGRSSRESDVVGFQAEARASAR